MTSEPGAPAVVLPIHAVAAPADRARPNYRLLGLLALGHLVIDTSQGSLPALLPHLKAALGLTYTAMGVSIFSAGGNIGIALGPPFITLLLTGFGMPGTLGMLVPGLLAAGLLLAVLPGLSRPLPATAHRGSLALPEPRLP